jgi:hypothetical protein
MSVKRHKIAAREVRKFLLRALGALCGSAFFGSVCQTVSPDFGR